MSACGVITFKQANKSHAGITETINRLIVITHSHEIETNIIFTFIFTCQRGNQLILRLIAQKSMMSPIR